MQTGLWTGSQSDQQLTADDIQMIKFIADRIHQRCCHVLL